MKKKIIVLAIVVLFIGVGVVSSGNNINNISNIERMDYFRNKDIRYDRMERINYFRNKDFRPDQIDNKHPIVFDGSLRGWSNTEVVSTESSETSYNACVAYDSDGGIHVVWDDDTNYGGSGSDKDIFYKMKPSGGSWSDTEVVSSESDRDCYFSSLVVDSNGDIHVVWDDYSSTEGNIYYKMKPSGGSWTSEELISTEGSDGSDQASIVVESDGTLHVTWCSWTDDEYSIFYKNKPGGGNWIDAEAISIEEIYIPYFPMLAVELDGTIHLAWDGYDPGTDEDIFYKKKPSGGSWSATEVVTTESTGFSSFPILEVDSNGDVHIIWYESTGSSTCDVCYKKKPSGGNWTSVEVISIYELAYLCDLAVEADGSVYVVWSEEDGYLWSIFYKSKPSGGSWTDAEVVSIESEDLALYPNVAVDLDGTVHVVWVDTCDYGGSGSDVDIFYKNKVGENQAPDIPEIDGPSSGVPGISYDYTFTATDPDGDAIAEFIVNWGDDTEDETVVGPSPASTNHTWEEQGSYLIKVKAKDSYGAESDWTEFEVEIPRNRTTYYSFFLWFLERFPSLERLLSHFNFYNLM